MLGGGRESLGQGLNTDVLAPLGCRGLARFELLRVPQRRSAALRAASPREPFQAGPPLGSLPFLPVLFPEDPSHSREEGLGWELDRGVEGRRLLFATQLGYFLNSGEPDSLLG